MPYEYHDNKMHSNIQQIENDKNVFDQFPNVTLEKRNKSQNMNTIKVVIIAARAPPCENPTILIDIKKLIK
jgi:hypothetical protein